jgi:hypothetical protein
MRKFWAASAIALVALAGQAVASDSVRSAIAPVAGDRVGSAAGGSEQQMEGLPFWLILILGGGAIIAVAAGGGGGDGGASG